MGDSNGEKEFVSHILNLMHSVGRVVSKRMFGGYGIFLDGLMFALISDNTLYFKTDNQTLTEFNERGLEAFSYTKKGKRCQLSYYQAPEDCLENTDDMTSWAEDAFSVALRANTKRSDNSL